MKITVEKIREEALKGYTEYSGIELLEADDGYAIGRVLIKVHHLNPSGAVHGGITFCLGDVIGGIACVTVDALPVTVSTSITYMRPMLGVKEITTRADVIKRGKTTLFVEISIYDDQGNETGRLLATYYDMKGRAK